MRILLRAFFAMAVAMAWLILPSCRKERLLLEKDPDAIGQFCRIDTFNFGSPPTYYEQVKVSYNGNGDPVSMHSLILPIEDGPQFDNIFFRYDKYNRLTDLIYVYPDLGPHTGYPFGDIDSWQRFTYPSPRIVVDSFYNYDGPGISYAGPGDPPIANPLVAGNLTVNRYYLDEQGRTVKTENLYVAAMDSGSFYTTYDRKGNKVIPGTVYDDKINSYRTNKVWQLIYQDYSLNNLIYPATANSPASILSYDKWGLPLVYVATQADPRQGLFDYFNDVTYLSLSYSCDESGSKLPPVSGQ